MASFLVLIAVAVAACAPQGATVENGIGGSPEGNRMPTSIPPRDGNIAIQEELDAARRAGTLAAYDLFIARHPHHPLSEAARKERQRIAQVRRR